MDANVIHNSIVAWACRAVCGRTEINLLYFFICFVHTLGVLSVGLKFRWCREPMVQLIGKKLAYTVAWIGMIRFFSESQKNYIREIVRLRDESVYLFLFACDMRMECGK